MAILLALAILVVLLAASGILYQSIGISRDAQRHSALGRFIDIGGRRLHLVEAGEGSPAVILESGIAATSLSWSLVQPAVARFARVCSYDRAGLGWSDSAGEPHTLEQNMADLRSLLSAAHISPPYVLVGHSYGGLLVRAYSARYPSEVAGLLLVDPLSETHWANAPEEELRRLHRGVLLSRRGASLARFGLVRFALKLLLSGATGLPKWIARTASGSGESVASRLVGEVQKLPPKYWPMIQAHWSNPKCFMAMASHLQNLPQNAEALLHMGALPPVPLWILSAASATPDEIAERDALAHSSPQGRHVLAPNTGHWIQFDHPELVVDTIRTVLDGARKKV